MLELQFAQKIFIEKWTRARTSHFESLRGLVNVLENFLTVGGGEAQEFFPRLFVKHNPPITTTPRTTSFAVALEIFLRKSVDKFSSDKMRGSPFFNFGQTEFLFAERDTLHEERHIPSERPHSLQALNIL